MSKIDLNDPRLTAYALNEMAPAERAEFEQALAQDEAARQAVAEISATVSALTSALEQEPVAPAANPTPKPDAYAKVIRFPYWTISSLAAACFAVFFIYWQRNEVFHPQKQYVEVPLSPAPAPEAESEPADATAADPGRLVVSLEEEKRDEIEAKARMNLAKREQERAAREVAVAQQNGSLKKDSEFAHAAAAPVALPVASASLDYGQARNQPPTPAAAADATDEKIVLDSFVVSADKSAGYAGNSTLAGTRVNSVLMGVGSVWGSSRGAAGRHFPDREANTEAYAFRKDNDYLRVKDQPLSTFSVDVDTASYANVRRFLTNGQRPPVDAVRIEELVNYFPYNYQPPAGNIPFATSLEAAAAPWAPTHRLVRIGLKGREVSAAGRPAANLVFLLDVSGSMNEPNKLPLVKQALRLLVQKLRPDDHVAIAVYAGASGLALPSTSAARQGEILDAIDRLQAEGSTNGAMGIQLAYDIAKANFVPGGVNRVILATDGDFNVGVTSEGELVRLVQEKAKSGVFLTVLGFGMGNIKDGTLEQLADKGNGNYAYIDNLAEAKKTLVEQAGGTLVTIAKDVKIQVEFNPAVVQAYRLIGYENRLLAKEDFNNDKVDAGEVGAGHTVTALYEVVPVGAEMPADMPAVDALKYQSVVATGATATTPLKHRGEVAAAPASAEMLTVKIRYKEPAGDRSNLLEFPLRDTGMAFANASQDFKFAAAVAAFGMVLRDSPHKGVATLDQVAGWARDGLGNDAGGYRSEFLGLVSRAQPIVQ